MKDLFSAFYSAAKSEWEVAWRDAIFVLDANILLNLYRFPLGTRRELLEIFDNLGDRLWVPFHAALEYQRNRPLVIADQQRKFFEVKSALDAGLDTMTQKLGSLQLATRHSIIDVTPIVNNISTAIDTFKVQLDELKKSSDFGLDSDAVRDRLDLILAGRVGAPLAKDDLAQIQKEGETRFKYLMPPGYLDAVKEKSVPGAQFMYGGLHYEHKFGDLIVWKQIIKHAKQGKLKRVIYLTDDAKDDWWLTINADGPKKIGPRPELREEIRREAGVEFFHMYDTGSFLKFASQYLGRPVPQKSIDEVADILNSSLSDAYNLELGVRSSINSDVGMRIRYWLEQCTQVQVLRTGETLAMMDSKAFEVRIYIAPPGKDVRNLLEATIIDSLVREDHIGHLIVVVGGDEDEDHAGDWFSTDKGSFFGEKYSVVYGTLGREERKSAKEFAVTFKPRFAAGKLGRYLLMLS